MICACHLFFLFLCTVALTRAHVALTACSHRYEKVSAVYQRVSGKQLPPEKLYLLLEITCQRVEDNVAVDVPYVRYRVR